MPDDKADTTHTDSTDPINTQIAGIDLLHEVLHPAYNSPDYTDARERELKKLQDMVTANPQSALIMRRVALPLAEITGSLGDRVDAVRNDFLAFSKASPESNTARTADAIASNEMSLRTNAGGISDQEIQQLVKDNIALMIADPKAAAEAVNDLKNNPGKYTENKEVDANNVKAAIEDIQAQSREAIIEVKNYDPSNLTPGESPAAPAAAYGPMGTKKTRNL